MDYPANLKFPVDQAVFTSVRSLMGEGYRLIAATPTVTAPERMEITQRCPSHAALCEDSPNAVGLLSFPLSTGRHCVGYTCHAGVEQTGRGGYRVYTHLAVVNPDNYAAADFDPVAIHCALARAMGEARILNPVSRLDPLELRIASPLSTSRVQPNLVCLLLAGLLANRRVVATGLDAPFDTLRCLVCALPAANRKTLFITSNLKFTLNRHTHLSLIHCDQHEIKRTLHGQDIDLIDSRLPLAVLKTPPAGWFSYVQKSLARQAPQSLAQLTRKINRPLFLADLDRLAGLCFDLEQVSDADAPTLHKLIIKYAAYKPLCEADTILLADFRIAAKNRSTELQKAEQTDENSPTPVSSHP